MINVLKNKVDIVTGPQLSKSNNLLLKARRGILKMVQK